MTPESKSPYIELASKEKDRYNKEMIVWRAKQKENKERTTAQNPSMVPIVNSDITEFPTCFGNKNIGQFSLGQGGSSASDTSFHQNHLYRHGQERYGQSLFTRESSSVCTPMKEQVTIDNNQGISHVHEAQHNPSTSFMQRQRHYPLQHYQPHHALSSSSFHQNQEAPLYPNAWFETQQQPSQIDFTRNHGLNYQQHGHQYELIGNVGGGDLSKMTPTPKPHQCLGDFHPQQSLRRWGLDEQSNKSKNIHNYNKDCHDRIDVLKSSSSSLSHLASKLDNDTIRFLTEFNFNGISKEDAGLERIG